LFKILAYVNSAKLDR